jgi:hypothetical protein
MSHEEEVTSRRASSDQVNGASIPRGAARGGRFRSVQALATRCGPRVHCEGQLRRQWLGAPAAELGRQMATHHEVTRSWAHA